MNPVSYLKTGVILCEDNLAVLAGMPSDCIDLIYLDPPFFSNRTYEVIWGDEAEVRSFEDRWEGGIQVYIDWMRKRAVHLHRVLKPTGSIYLHCDWHASHYLRVMMDGIFGASNFQNEIVWCYEVGGRGKKRWARKHDTILFYSKSQTFHFDWAAVAEPRKAGTHMKARVDEDGRPYQEKRDARSGKVYRYYVDEGTIPPDWWMGPQQLNREAAERIGYPTQKPEALLAKIVAASSAKGDIVLDPFCGCGTAIAVAHKLDRAWLGVDISPTALGIMQRRLEKSAPSWTFRVSLSLWPTCAPCGLLSFRTGSSSESTARIRHASRAIWESTGYRSWNNSPCRSSSPRRSVAMWWTTLRRP